MKKSVILISGKQRSGKSTIAEALVIRLIKKGFHPRRGKFATPLYEMHDAVQDVLAGYGVPTPDVEPELLQYLGTEYGREKYGEDIWVNILKVMAARVFAEGADVLIVDDCRFKNEVVCFDNEEGVRVLKIRLECPEAVRKERSGGKWRENTQHKSEVGLDGYEDWDLVIDTEKEIDAELAAEMVELLWEVRK